MHPWVRDDPKRLSATAAGTVARGRTPIATHVKPDGSVPIHPGTRKSERTSMSTTDLHNTTDAMVWAREFVETLREHPDTADPHDEGFMVGWFANAIETGRAAGAGAA